MKSFLLLLLMVVTGCVSGQWNDSFDPWDSTRYAGCVSCFGSNQGRLVSKSDTLNHKFGIYRPFVMTKVNESRLTLDLPFKTSSANRVRWILFSSNGSQELSLEFGGTKDQIELIHNNVNDKRVVFSSEHGISEKFSGECRAVFNSKGIRLITTGTYSLDTQLQHPILFSAGAHATTGIEVTQSTSSFFGKHHFDGWYAGAVVRDTTAPSLIGTNRNDHHEITFLFSEEVDPQHFELQLPAWMSSVQYQINAENSSWKVRFGNSLRDTVYELQVSDVKDTAGNVMVDTTLSTLLVYGKRPQPGELVLNELMIDPSPPIGLETAEYVELLNISDHFLRTEGLTLSDDKNTAPLPAWVVPPDSFLLLSKDSILPGHPLLEGFPSLNNSSEFITLSFGGAIIDTFSFQLSRYSTYPSGGVSLERLNPRTPCSFNENWNWSQDSRGGTPGKENSILNQYLGSEPVSVIDVSLINDSSVQLRFNRPINWSTSSRLVSINEVETTMHPLSMDRAVITASEISETNRVNEIVVKAISGCNRIDTQFLTAQFIRPGIPDHGDIYFNEIMFDPGETWSEYIELYMQGDQMIDLSELVVQRKNHDTIYKESVISQNRLIAFPGDLILLTSDPQFCTDHYCPSGTVFAPLNLFPLPNDGAALRLVHSSENQVIDSFTYHPDLHFEWLETDEGISLERIGETENWASCAQHFGGGTPGDFNSHRVVFQSQNEPHLELLSPVVSPNLDGYQDALFIRVRSNSSHLVMEGAVFNSQGELTSRVTDWRSFGSNQIIRWDPTDQDGELLSSGLYFLVMNGMTSEGKTFRWTHAITLLSH
jgi:hypothetical protein